MNITEYKEKYQNNDSSPGWDCIDNSLKNIYGNVEPKHYAPILHASLGGDIPLDGISVYNSNSGKINHLHFITYGYSMLYYDEESFGQEFSKFGFEMTFRLTNHSLDDASISWVINFLNNISKYVFKTGKYFKEFDYFNANGPIHLGLNTDITAIAFILDSELGQIETPHGIVQFIQAFGITTKEFAELKNEKMSVKELFNTQKTNNNLLVTDLNRSAQQVDAPEPATMVSPALQTPHRPAR